MNQPIKLKCGPLEDPNEVPENRWIVPAVNTTPAKMYRKEGVAGDYRWQQLTSDMVSASYMEYSAVDLVNTFETGLMQP